MRMTISSSLLRSKNWSPAWKRFCGALVSYLDARFILRNSAFDTESRQAFINDKPQTLSARETSVLELLMRCKDRVVSKKLVEDQIFGLSSDVASNAVEVYVHQLRKQLSERGARVQIHTIRGVGYLMSEERAA